MANESEANAIYNFFYKPIPRDPDPSIFLTLHPECNFTSQAPDLPAAAFPIAWLMAIVSLVYFIVPLPVFFARKHIFPLTLKSPPLILTVCTGFLMMDIFIYWRDILGNKMFPCLDYAIYRMFFIPFSFIPYIAELNRLCAKISLGDAVDKLDAAPPGEEFDRCLAQVKTAKARTRWQADIWTLCLACVPSIAYFCVVVYPDPKVYFGCIGCVIPQSDSLMLSGLAGLCAVAAAYLLHQLRNYPDELGLRKEIKRSLLVICVSVLLLQVWKRVGEKTITPFLHTSNLIMAAAFYIYYTSLIRPTLMTFPAIQRRTLAARRRRIRAKNQARGIMWCCGCRNSAVFSSRMAGAPHTTIVSLDMAHVLAHDECSELFQAHLGTEFNQENILFWKHATDWINNFDNRSLEENVKESKDIYDQYICDHACMQVNLNAHQFTALKNVFKSNTRHPKGTNAKVAVDDEEQGDIGTRLTKTVFDDAIDEIFLLMKRDMLPRFKAGKRYQQALDAYRNTSKAGSFSAREGARALSKRLVSLVSQTSEVAASSHARGSTFKSRTSKIASQTPKSSSVAATSTRNSQRRSKQRRFLPAIYRKSSPTNDKSDGS